MNERIRELAFKAANGMLSFDAEGDWRLNEKEVEKFAELIVRECIECLNPLSKNHSMVGAAKDTIKNHFGVEE